MLIRVDAVEVCDATKMPNEQDDDKIKKVQGQVLNLLPYTFYILKVSLC
jgi:hypothetical protein